MPYCGYNVIKNRTALESSIVRSKPVMNLLELGLQAANPENFMPKFLKKMDEKHVHLISYGKAAHPMARAASKYVKILGGIIVAPNGGNLSALPKTKLYRASHPIPDNSCRLAARAIQRYLVRLNPKDHVLFLVSGGGSSLLAHPIPPVTISDAADTTRILLDSGAKISQINCIRRHISQVAGGKLLCTMRCRGTALIMSDVQGNVPLDISSGCTVPDSTTPAQALRYVKEFKLESKLPKTILRTLAYSAKYRIPPKAHVRNTVIASGADCARIIAIRARKMGLHTRTMKIYGDIVKESERIVKRTVTDRDSCLVFYGEPTVRVAGCGRGGRNQELVLRLLSQYRNAGIRCVAASVGTDGMDGNTRYAGAVCDSSKPAKSTEISKMLSNNDSSAFFAKHGGHIMTGPTGTNLADVGLVIVRKAWQSRPRQN